MGWKLTNDRQIWIQLTDIIRLRIVSGQYPAGCRIPSVRDLAEEAGVNPNTMQRALSSLEEAELVTAARSTGRYVTTDSEKIAESRRAMAESELCAFRRRMRQLGYTEKETAQLLKQEGKANE